MKGTFGPYFGKLNAVDRALIRAWAAATGTAVRVVRFKRHHHPVAVEYRGTSYPISLSRREMRDDLKAIPKGASK